MLSVETLAARLAAGGPEAPFVIDVRQPSEYEAGHVPGSTHIGAGDLPEMLDRLPRDRPIATICASGYRTSVAASMLRAAGFEDVVTVSSGVPTWESHGFPVAYGPGPGGDIREPAATDRRAAPPLGSVLRTRSRAGLDVRPSMPCGNGRCDQSP